MTAGRVVALRALAVVMAMAGPLHASAQADRTGQVEGPTEWPDDLHVGPFRFTPSLGLSFGYDSNVNLQSDERTSSSFARLSPALRVERGGDRSRFAAVYNAEIARYSESGLDNYVDQRLGVDWFYSPFVRHAFIVGASYGWLHDQRGTAAREGDLGLLPLEPDEYERADLDFGYRFGAPGARGRLEFQARAVQVEYQNNRELTRFRDRDDLYLAGGFFWQVAPKTSALLRVEHASIDYTVANLDSDELHYFVGLDWEATAKTTGRVMVGRQEKDFADPNRADASGLTWRATVQWRPRSYSIFDLSTGAEFDETNGTGDYIERRDVALGWQYQWSARLATNADVGYSREQYGASTRDDSISYYGVSASYAMRRWLRLGASARTVRHSSSLGEFDYIQNVYLLSAEISPSQ